MSSPASVLSADQRARVAALFAKIYAATDRRVAIRAAVADASFPALVTYEGDDATFANALLQRASDYGASVLVELIRGCETYVGDDIERDFADVFAALGFGTGAAAPVAGAFHIVKPFGTFRGRADDLEWLVANIKAGESVAVVGPAGFGKTQLARKAAFDVRETFRRQFEIVVETPESTAAGLVALASVVANRIFAPDETNAAREVAQRFLEANADVLVLLDNADDAGVLAEIPRDGWRGAVVVTGRDENAVVGMACRVLETVSEADGAAILLACAPKAARETDAEAHAAALSVDLDGLPIAIAHAGAYIATTGMSFARYRDAYAQTLGQILAKSPGKYPIAVRSVAATVQKTCEYLAETAPIALEILQYTAFLDPDTIADRIFTAQAATSEPVYVVASDELVECAGDTDAFAQEIATLERVGMLTGRVIYESFSVHRTTQDVLFAALSDADVDGFIGRTCALVSAAYSTNALDKWEHMTLVMPSILRCVDIAHTRGLKTPFAARAAARAASILANQGEYDRAEALQQHAEGIWCAIEGAEGCNAVATRSNRAQTLTYAGRYEEAAALLEAVLKINEATLGASHRDTGRVLHQLAMAYTEAGQYDRAEPLYRRALSILEGNGRAVTCEYAGTLNALGVLYQSTKEWEKARQFQEQSLCLTQQVLSPNHPDLAMSFYNLARFFYDTNLAGDALPLFYNAMVIAQKHLPLTHQDRLAMEKDYARCLRDLSLTEDDTAAMAGDTSSP